MRSRKAADDQVAAVARRRLELLSAELSASSPPDEGAAQRAATTGVPSASGGEPWRTPGRHAQRPLGRGELLGGWLRDRLPPTLQGRVGLSSAHLAVVALLVAVGVAAAAWWVVRAEPQATTLVQSAARPSQSGSASQPPDVVHREAVAPASGLPASGPAASGPAASGPAASGSPASAGAASPPNPAGTPLVVDVAGKVHDPGIVRLRPGSRVADALQAAGGPRRKVDLSSLNLARRLADGEQVLVGVSPPPGAAAAAAAAAPPAGTASSPSTMVNLNTAAGSDLETLPGVGPVTAQKILQWRSTNGPFHAVDELLEVSGIGDATLAEIAPFATL